MEKTNLTYKWDYGTLVDAVDKGSSNISLNKVKDDDGEYPLFSAKGFNKNISFFQQEIEYLAIIKDGAGIGRVSQHPAKSSVVATMQYLIPKEGFDIGFIKYFLNGIDFESHRQGSTIPHVYFKDYKSEPFPLLPLPQQKQIVVILDKAFTAIDTAKANAKQNLENAKELFESYLQNVFSTKGDDWEEKTLGEVVELISGQHIDAKNYNIEGKGIGYLTGPSDFGIISPSISKWTEYPKRNAIKDDVLITVKGSGVGKVNLMSAEELCISRQLMAIRPKEIEVMFLYTFVSTKYKYFQSLANGAAIPGISRVDVLNLVISIPTLEQQKIIVKKTDSLSAETKKLEAIYTQKLADLEEMKKSVLQKAFSGKLTIDNEILTVQNV